MSAERFTADQVRAAINAYGVPDSHREGILRELLKPKKSRVSFTVDWPSPAATAALTAEDWHVILTKYGLRVSDFTITEVNG